MRQKWEMQFVSGAVDALHSLGRTAFDVVVSDMRMPGMDGVQLLKEVQSRFPQVMRIVLSGQSDQAMIDRSHGATHQYLAKPCRPELLKGILLRACHLQELLPDQQMRCLVTGMSSIATLPLLHRALMRELEMEHPSPTAITAIMSEDLGMTAKLLQIAHSTSVRGGEMASTVEEAVNMLGVETIRSMVRSGEGCSVMSEASSGYLNIDQLWTESLKTGSLARAIAQAEQASPQTINQAGTAGLLHEIGGLIMAGHASERYAQTLELSQDRKCPLWQAEQQLFNCTHAQVGGYLLGLWGIAEPIVEAVTYHHTPAQHAVDAFCPLTAVHVADCLQNELAPSWREGAPAQLDWVYLERLRLTDRLPAWREAAAAWRRNQVHE
jgi:HD-like signal output (HDOD) protein